MLSVCCEMIVNNLTAGSNSRFVIQRKRHCVCISLVVNKILTTCECSIIQYTGQLLQILQFQTSNRREEACINKIILK
jgi:hypothetical protein